MKIIIMVSGFAGSGKDTASDYIAKTFGFAKYGLADSLKDLVSAKFNLSRPRLDDQCYKKTSISNNKTVRDLLIEEATKARAENVNVWIDKTIAKFKEDKIIISDFRYPNEYFRLIEKFEKVITVRITRDTAVPLPLESEHQLDTFKFDLYLNNNGKKKDLFLQLYQAISSELEKLK